MLRVIKSSLQNNIDQGIALVIDIDISDNKIVSNTKLTDDNWDDLIDDFEKILTDEYGFKLLMPIEHSKYESSKSRYFRIRMSPNKFGYPLLTIFIRLRISDHPLTYSSQKEQGETMRSMNNHEHSVLADLQTKFPELKDYISVRDLILKNISYNKALYQFRKTIDRIITSPSFLNYTNDPGKIIESQINFVWFRKLTEDEKNQLLQINKNAKSKLINYYINHHNSDEFHYIDLNFDDLRNTLLSIK